MRCPFCALPEMEWADGPWKFMEGTTYTTLIDDLATWVPKIRLEFAERGEQTFHPKLTQFIQYMRLAMPLAQLTITSNGDTIRKYKDTYIDWVHSLLDAGLNIMMLDCYTEERYDLFKRLFPKAVRLYEDGYHPYRYIGPKEKTILLVDGTYGKNHIIRRWHNTAGLTNVERARAAGYAVNDVTEPMKAMCVRPFREIEVHYDGAVPLCCIDWKEEVMIGNILQTSTKELWSKMDSYREILLRKARNEIPTCARCSERSGFRVGFEMDWFK